MDGLYLVLMIKVRYLHCCSNTRLYGNTLFSAFKHKNKTNIYQLVSINFS